MNPYIEKLKQQIADNPPNYGDADSVLGLLYECFNENNPYDNEQIKADFEELYQQMNGMPLREIGDTIFAGVLFNRCHYSFPLKYLVNNQLAVHGNLPLYGATDLSCAKFLF